MSTRRRMTTALMAITLALAACGDDAPPQRESAPTTTPGASAPASTTGTETSATETNVTESSVTESSVTESSVTATSVVGDAFPVTVTGGSGDVTIESRPGRIVVLSPSLTEMVFAVGAADQVVAVDTYSDVPADAPRSDLSGFRPNVEAIGALEPDLVLVARDSDGIVETLAGVGIPALVLPSAGSLEDVYAQIQTIGAATGHTGEARGLVDRMRTEIAAQLARLEGASLPATYFYEISNDYKTLTSDTFVGSILAGIGMANVADGVDPAAGAYPQLSAEYVLEADPGQLFVAHADGTVPSLAELADRPGWSNLQAVAGGRVILLDTDVASRWGPRVVDLVSSIVDGLLGAS